MSNFIRTKLLSKNLLFNIIFLLLALYFIFHSIYGDRGLISYLRLNKKLSQANLELNDLQAKRARLEHKAALLRSDSLDLDILEEQAKKILGLASSKERIFKVKNKN